MRMYDIYRCHYLIYNIFFIINSIVFIMCHTQWNILRFSTIIIMVHFAIIIVNFSPHTLYLPTTERFNSFFTWWWLHYITIYVIIHVDAITEVNNWRPYVVFTYKDALACYHENALQEYFRFEIASGCNLNTKISNV